jgi:uncharacterized membrane protein YphA (DoxX/SURF4 family)
MISAMQRLFSMFPTSYPGIALVLMRFSLGISMTQGMAEKGTVIGHSGAQLLSCLLALSIALGIATPLVAGLAVAVQIATVVISDLPYQWPQVCGTLDAIALVLLGPGAYSVDARIFGRRRIDIGKSDDA